MSEAICEPRLSQLGSHPQMLVASKRLMTQRPLLAAGTHRRINYIQMPEAGLFTGTDTSSATEAMYATLLHEGIHATGHKCVSAAPPPR